MKNTEATKGTEMDYATKVTRGHIEGCTSGLRYAATVRTTKATLADGTAGKVLMVCKNSKCPGSRLF